MKISDNGIGLIKHFEKCRLIAYPDPATGGDPWTCGWGQTGSDIFEGMVWSQEYADRRFVAELEKVSSTVLGLLKVDATQGQFDALCSLAYNLGAGNVGKSTLLRKLNAGDVSGASAEFPKWNRANGQIMRGLTRRRYAERALFDGESLADAIRIGSEAA